MTFNTKLRAKNLGLRRGKIEFIVLHDTAGSGTSNDAKYLANDPEHRGISVDFCIDNEGTVWQLNPTLLNNYTFHAGRKTRFRGRVNRAVNQHSIGIEIAQKAKLDFYPLVQVRAVADVCRFLCETFALTRGDIITHKAIITDGSRSDPRGFPWDEFWAYFVGNADQNVTDEHTTHKIVKGDTLWSLAKRFNTTIEHLKDLNDMNSPKTTIRVGYLFRVQ